MIRAVGAALVCVLALTSCSSGEQAPRAAAGAPTTGLSWTRGAALPTPRTEIAVAALAGRIYVAGGITGGGDVSDRMEVYDPAADGWSTSTRLPTPLHHAALVAAGSRLALVGGYNDDGTASRRMWTWAPGEQRWRRSSDLPTPRGACSAVGVERDGGSRIVVVGGASGFRGNASLVDETEVYDPARRSWAASASFPGPRDHLAAASIREAVLVVGGRELSLASNRDRLDVFDVEAGAWRPGPPMPTARGGIAAAAVGDRLFVFGGEQPSGTFDDAEVFDHEDQTWSSAPRMPSARHGLGAAAIGNRVYVIGGGPTPGLSVTGANEILVVGD